MESDRRTQTRNPVRSKQADSFKRFPRTLHASYRARTSRSFVRAHFTHTSRTSIQQPHESVVLLDVARDVLDVVELQQAREDVGAPLEGAAVRGPPFIAQLRVVLLLEPAGTTTANHMRPYTDTSQWGWENCFWMFCKTSSKLCSSSPKTRLFSQHSRSGLSRIALLYFRSTVPKCLHELQFRTPLSLHVVSAL